MTIITGDNNQTEIGIETGASSISVSVVNEEKKNEDMPPKKKVVETYEERQIRLKTEARAFALSGYYSTTKKQQLQQKTTKKRTTLPVKRRRAVVATMKAAAAYSSDESSNSSSSSSISDFSDDDNNNHNYNYNNNGGGGGSNKKRKVTQQEPTGGGGSIYTPQVVSQMPMMYPQFHLPSQSQPHPQLSTQSQYNRTAVVVRVQVPYKELFPGRKMVVDLPNRLPLEVIIPSHILPGTIIPVQVPPLLNNNPYYYYSQQNNHPQPHQQQQGQQQQPQQQKEQVVGNEKRNTTTFWDQNWYNMFNRLVAYQKEFNTTNISRRQHRSKDTTRLGRWSTNNVRKRTRKLIKI